MISSVEIKKRIPTNLITGFLGSGKTTTLLNILRQKPAQEKWAVLVNEFGEIGIDGAIMAGHGAEIRQIAGGCMCCVAELPMKVALNNLINRTEPDRLLIETTGLGHPQTLVDTLTSDPYDKLLELRAVIALLDPRKLHEARYLEHPIFRDQLNIADVVIANKTDLSNDFDRIAFDRFIAALQPPKQAIGWIARGQLRMEWLDLKRTAPHSASQAATFIGSIAPKPAGLLNTEEIFTESFTLQPGELFARREHNDDGYFSCGWLLTETVRFDYDALIELLSALDVVRIKALLKTSRGDYLVNNEGDSLQIDKSSVASINAIEIIHDRPLDWQSIERQLLDKRC